MGKVGVIGNSWNSDVDILMVENIVDKMLDEKKVLTEESNGGILNLHPDAIFISANHYPAKDLPI